jgi:hypothetical protein
MSGAEDDFLGYVDEFIENAAEDVVDDHSLVFEKIDNSFDSSFDNFPSDIQEKALARLDIIKFVERRYPPHDPTGRFSFNVRSSREAVS